MCRIWDAVWLSCPAGKCREEMVVKSSVLKELEECYRESGNHWICAVRADGLGERAAARRICAEQEAFYYRGTGGGLR